MIRWFTGHIKNIKGFSITEILFVAIISTIVITTIVSMWMFTNQVWIQKNEQTMLRIDLMKALEVIKKDIRLSSFTDMSFYPNTGTNFTAVSMPVADVDSNGFFTFNAQGKITWSRTVIYHIYTDISGQKTLRRTVYDPRNNSMTEDQRYTQLESVVTNGTGGSGSTTETDFLEGLDTFEISPLSSVFDFYDESSTAIKVGKVVFGWAKLDPGDHVIKFVITGKNDASSGYDIGIDSLMIEPSGIPREVEYYNSSYAHSGAINLSGGSAALVNDDIWGNNNYLEFRASGIGDYVEFTDYYDLWRESSFEVASLNNAELTGSEVRAALAVPEEDDEGEYAWFAYMASGDPSQEGSDGNFNTIEAKSDVEEVVLRTAIMSSVTSMSEQEVDPERSLVRIRLKSASSGPLTIDRAYITRKDPSGSYNGLTNITPSSPYDPSDYHRHQQLFFRDSSGKVSREVTIPADSEVFSLWSAFPFHTDNDYFITMYISDASSLDCKYWVSSGSVPNTYYITKGETIDCNVVGNIFNASGHGLSTGDDVLMDLSSSYMSNISGTPNWALSSPYVVEVIDSDTFRLSSGGSYLTPSSGDHTVCLFGGVYNSPNVYICANVDTWDASGIIQSQITDTTLASPAYNEIKYSENRPAGSSIILKARSSANDDMSGATDWDSITGSSANPYSLSIGSGRYVQFQSEFSTEPYWEEEGAGNTLSYSRYIQIQALLSSFGNPQVFPTHSGDYYITQLDTPWIDDVTIDWPGASSICTLTGYVSKKDSYGKAMITIDGEALLKVLSLHLKIDTMVQDKTITAENYIEIEPRNTGK